MMLYSIDGKREHPDLSMFPAIPDEPAVLALKYNDSLDDARWITDLDDLREMRSADAPLSYTHEGIAALQDPFSCIATMENLKA